MAADLPSPQSIRELQTEIANHPVFDTIRTVEALRTFMEHHVACVWDFMSLLKSLQHSLAPAEIPWLPPEDPTAARLINEIVLGEESDVIADQPPQSHFELYLRAMAEIGAPRNGINSLLSLLRKQQFSIDIAIQQSALPPAAKQFAQYTFSIMKAPLPCRLAVFYYGRENLLPDVFARAVQQINKEHLTCGILTLYLERHIESDRYDHGPIAKQLLERYCSADEEQQLALQTAHDALTARKRLFDQIAELNS